MILAYICFYGTSKIPNHFQFTLGRGKKTWKNYQKWIFLQSNRFFTVFREVFNYWIVFIFQLISTLRTMCVHFSPTWISNTIKPQYFRDRNKSKPFPFEIVEFSEAGKRKRSVKKLPTLQNAEKNSYSLTGDVWRTRKAKRLYVTNTKI